MIQIQRILYLVFDLLGSDWQTYSEIIIIRKNKKRVSIKKETTDYVLSLFKSKKKNKYLLLRLHSYKIFYAEQSHYYLCYYLLYTY